MHDSIFNFYNGIKFNLFLARLYSYLPKSVSPKPPSTVTIDVSSLCNLECPICYKERKKYRNNEDYHSYMGYSDFQRIIDKLSFIKKVYLFQVGEPFLNPEIFQILYYLKDKKISSIISSNFSFEKEEKFFEDIVKSGLSELSISLDGAKQVTYEKYRKKGNFDLIISNIKKLNKVKQNLQSKTPKIYWLYTINKYNQHEINQAKRIAKKLKINFDKNLIISDFSFIMNSEHMHKKDQQWLPSIKKYISPLYKKEKFPIFNHKCLFPFSTMVVDPVGYVFPCCHVADKKYNFGNILNESFEDIWYGKKYLSSRSIFCKKQKFKDSTYTICTSCKLFKKYSK